MRLSTRMTPLAMALLVAACGSAPEEGQTAMDTAEAATAADRAMTTDLACQPSQGMPVAGRASPYDSTTIRLGGAGHAKICYGRPSLRGRTMIGGEAVPYGSLWRTGANEPTIVHLDTRASIAGLEVEPGSYSLYTVPEAGDEWTLIVNRSTSQWGHESRYTDEVRSQEVGRVRVSTESVDPRVEQMTIRPAPAGEDGVVLEWQNTRVHIPITAAR